MWSWSLFEIVLSLVQELLNRIELLDLKEDGCKSLQILSWNGHLC